MYGKFPFSFLGLAMLILLWFFAYKNGGVNKKSALLLSIVLAIQVLLGLFTDDDYISLLIVLFAGLYFILSYVQVKNGIHAIFVLSSFIILLTIAYSIMITPISYLVVNNYLTAEVRQAMRPFLYIGIPVISTLAMLGINRLIHRYKITNYLFYTKPLKTLGFSVYALLSLIFVWIRHKNSFPDFENDFFYSTLILFLFYAICFILLAFQATNTFKKQENQMLLNMFEKEEAEIDEKNRFQHDYKNLIGALRIFLENNQIEEAKAFLKELANYSESEVKENEKMLYNLGNPELKAATKLMWLKARKNQIKFELQVPQFVYHINLPMIDFIRSYTVLLDNAIESANGMENGFIKILIKEENEKLSIQIKNTFEEYPDLHQIFSEGFSTKRKQHHGLGLSNLKRIINKYSNLHHFITIENDLVISLLIIEAEA